MNVSSLSVLDDFGFQVVNDKRMVVRSFAVLEPCGLDLFTGVEFVCCPGDDKTEGIIVILKILQDIKCNISAVLWWNNVNDFFFLFC